MLRRGTLTLLFSFCGLVCAAAAAKPTKPTRPPSWFTVRTEHFTVLTSSDAATAQRWAADLERIRAGLSKLMTVRADRLAAVTVVVFPDDASFRPYKLLENGKPAPIGGYFARSESVHVIGLANGIDPLATRRVIFHEATHWFLDARETPLPMWLEEGIAELFSTFLADEKQFTVGDSLPEHVRYLRTNGLPPIQELVGAGRDTFKFNDRDRTGRFYAGAWLFVHWVSFGEGSPGPASLQRYLDLLKQARDPQAAFATAFGGNYAEIGKRLQAYLKKGQYFRRTEPLPPETIAISPAKTATAADLDYALGALLLASHGPAEALPRLRRAAAAEPDAPRAWEAIGFAELRSDNKAGALAAFDRAARAGSHIALVWNNRAALRDAAERPASAGGLVLTTDRSSMNASAADFRRAIDLDPRCEPAYRGLAGVVYGAETVDPADITRFERAAFIFPKNEAVALGHALALLRSDRRETGERELLALLARDRLESAIRQLGENALENEKLRVIGPRLDALAAQHRFRDMIVEIDAVLADDAIRGENRRSLRATRRQAEQLAHLEQGVEAFNAGRLADAAAISRGLLAAPPANPSIRLDAERLLRLSTGGPDD